MGKLIRKVHIKHDLHVIRRILLNVDVRREFSKIQQVLLPAPKQSQSLGVSTPPTL